MQAEGIRLVVPKGLHKAFPEEIRGELMSLSAFINEIKNSILDVFLISLNVYSHRTIPAQINEEPSGLF